ncbi:hypothetical protein BC829DRAFT_418122 [Chytridium lagenaria]|nr:hypothetical protein BC829DRAFT_418122 [Chytridium lagenaria]
MSMSETPSTVQNDGKVDKTKKRRPKLNGAGIPENARLLSLKAGTDLPIIKDLSNNFMAQFRAMNALLGVPFCHENINRFMRNQRPRRNGERERTTANKTPSVANKRAPLPISVDNSDDEDVPSAASSSRVRHHERLGTKSSRHSDPMDCDDDNSSRGRYTPRDIRRNSLDGIGSSTDDEIFLLASDDNPSVFEELEGSDRDEAIRQRKAGNLDPRVLVTKRPGSSSSRTTPKPSGEASANPASRREKELTSNGSKIAVIRLMVDRLKVLELDVSLSEPRLVRDPSYRNHKLDSVISLVTQRRQYLHNTSVKIRAMIVDTTARIGAIEGFEPLKVKELAPEKQFSDASLVAIRRELAASLLDNQMRLHDLESGLKESSFMPALPPPPPEPRPRPSDMRENISKPPPVTKIAGKPVLDEVINLVDTTTDTTTASRGSVNASDDESDLSDHLADPRQVKPLVSGPPLRAPRGVRHHGMLVDDLTTRLHRLEYKPKIKVVATSSSLALVRRHLPPADAMAAASASVKQKVSLAEYKARLVASREKNNDPCNEERRKSIEDAVASHAACVKKAHEESEAVVIDESPLSTRSTSPKFSPISAKAMMLAVILSLVPRRTPNRVNAIYRVYLFTFTLSYKSK